MSDVTVTSDMDCQTDAFLDKPATPVFIPAKTGKDVGTQIEEGEVGDPIQELWLLLWKLLSGSNMNQDHVLLFHHLGILM